MNPEKNKQMAPQVVLAQHGNKDAYKNLYVAYHKNVFFICKLMSGDTVAAMNLTQEIFIKMFESVSKLTDHMAFEQWFYSIAINVCKPCAANAVTEIDGMGKDMKDIVTDIRKSVLEGDKFCFERSVMNLLEKIIISLPYDVKFVFLYKYFASLDEEKIALLEKKEEDEISDSVSAVCKFISRISDKLCEEGVDISPFTKNWENSLCYLAAHTFVPDFVHRKVSEAVGIEMNPFAVKI